MCIVGNKLDVKAERKVGRDEVCSFFIFFRIVHEWRDYFYDFIYFACKAQRCTGLILFADSGEELCILKGMPIHGGICADRRGNRGGV